MSDDKHQQDLATQIKTLHKSGEFDKALEISKGALKSNPPDLEAYNARWKLMTDMFSEAEAKEKINPEIEMVLRTHPVSPELYYTVHRGYKRLPGRAKNVPKNIFEKMLQFPGTKTYLSALLGLAQQSEDEYQQWHYYQRLINECTVSDGPSSWYMLAYEKMLRLTEQDRALASDDYIDELIDGLLNAHLFMCRETQQFLGWAYIEAVERRLKFNNRLDKALETLARAEIRLAEKEEQTWLVENNKGSVEGVHRDFLRLRAEIHLRQERWQEAYNGLLANAPDFLESLWTRFKEGSMNYFYMLGRSAEGIGEWEIARHYYANAHFAPTPHPEAQVGLERVYHQMEQGEITDTFEAFLKNTEVEYRIREEADREKIRQKFITNRLNKEAADFRLETLDGETYTLSEMLGKVILLDVGASWCGPCNMAIPHLKIVYERFSESDDVVVWGINDGETPQKVQESLDEHQPPWPVLLDPNREVAKAYKVRAIPKFIFIDKNGYWQYNFGSSNIIDGQPLIWMIEALLSD